MSLTAARQMVINSCLESYCATEQESKDFSLGIWGLAHSHFKPNEEEKTVRTRSKKK